MLKGQENRQNDGQIQLFLTTLTGLRAAAWAGDPNPEYGFDQPSLLIKISYQSGEQSREAEIKFGKCQFRKPALRHVHGGRGRFSCR